MRVLLVTSADPETGMTGVATYVKSMADALAGLGHEIAHYFSTPPHGTEQPRLDVTLRGGNGRSAWRPILPMA